MYDFLVEAGLDTAKVFPLLFIIYIFIEIIEVKYGEKVKEIVEKSGRTGPILGALTSSIPQCGFSAIAAVLYSQKLVTIGTLMAVFIATSDEAIPVILSNPEKANIILPLIGIKIVLGIIFGYILDIIFRRSNLSTLQHIEVFKTGHDTHNHQISMPNRACCGHKINSRPSSPSINHIISHSIIHSLTISGYIFLTSALLSFALMQINRESLTHVFSQFPLFQPFIVALIGLIPNCAASVVIAEAYINGIISYGSMVGGLCAGGGLGILVLARELKNKRTVALITGLLFMISVFTGIILNLLAS